MSRFVMSSWLAFIVVISCTDRAVLRSHRDPGRMKTAPQRGGHTGRKCNFQCSRSFKCAIGDGLGFLMGHGSVRAAPRARCQRSRTSTGAIKYCSELGYT